MIATTRPEMSVSEPTLYVAFELGKKDWQLAMTSGFGIEPWVRTVPSGDLRAVERVLREGRRRLGLPASARVMSCYEAGRDGFWPHRWLTQLGVTNLVVDSSSIEVPRRARRAKTDRLDGEKLLRLLLRHWGGERGMWHVVAVPTREQEDARRASRGLTAGCRRCGGSPWRWRGPGSGISRPVSSRSGICVASAGVGRRRAALELWHWPGGSSSRCGAMLRPASCRRAPR